MKNIIVVLFMVIAASVSAIVDDGWVDLFDGKSLKGWHPVGGKHTFKVEDGIIVGSPVQGEGNGFLRTDDIYSDFVVEFDAWWDSPLNSGFQIRSIQNKLNGSDRVQGYQIEFDPSPRAWSAGIIDESRHGWLYSLTRNPKAQAAVKLDNWNHFRIEAIGDNIKTWINGVPAVNLVVDFEDEGFLGLQVNGIKTPDDHGKFNRWKNIRIKTSDLASETRAMPDDVEQFNFIPNTLTKRQIAEGWRLLFDGKTTDGWRGAKLDTFPDSGWAIKDGILSTLESGGAESRNGGDIITTEEFSSFELELDFRIAKGANSGIKYFVDPEMNKGEGSAIGPEFQLVDDKYHRSAKRGIVSRTMGSLYDLIPATNLSEEGRTNKRVNALGKWNRARLVVKGSHVEHWLNNSKVVEYERGSEEFRSLVQASKYAKWPTFGELEKGPILLQEHGNSVEFRSIKIREFK